MEVTNLVCTYWKALQSTFLAQVETMTDFQSILVGQGNRNVFKTLLWQI